MRTRDGALSCHGARSVAGGDVISQLTMLFRRNGYARWQDARRVEEDGSQRYKKGDEVRLVANAPEELTMIRRLLREAGFRPGRPFVKGLQHRQPIYGREAVRRFLELVGEGKKESRGPTARRRGRTDQLQRTR